MLARHQSSTIKKLNGRPRSSEARTSRARAPEAVAPAAAEGPLERKVARTREPKSHRHSRIKKHDHRHSSAYVVTRVFSEPARASAFRRVWAHSRWRKRARPSRGGRRSNQQPATREPHLGFLVYVECDRIGGWAGRLERWVEASRLGLMCTDAYAHRYVGKKLQQVFCRKFQQLSHVNK